MASGRMLILLFIGSLPMQAQDISGYWQGVLYQEYPGNTVYYPYSMSLQQTGTDVTGISEIRWADEPIYYGIMSLTGQFDGSLFTFQEQAILDQNPNPAAYWCIKHGELLYDPVLQTLEGPWDAPGCFPGTVELHRLALNADTIFCLGDSIRLEVTGIGIRWYADSTLLDLLDTGNVFFPSITATSVFYVTQTHYGTESPAFPVRVVISSPLISNVDIQPTGCDSDMGSLLVESAGGMSPLEFSVNGIDFQTEPLFTGLAAGSYLLILKDSLGCRDSVSVDIPFPDGPQILELDAPDIPCGRDTVTVNVSAVGGTGILRYSLNGSTPSEQPAFHAVGVGTYILHVRDEAGCVDSVEFTLSLLPGPILMEVAKNDPSCSGGDGLVLVTAYGGTLPLSYSLDGLSFQTDSVFDGLHAGTYSLFVRDAWGCMDSMDLSLADPPVFTVSFSVDTARCDLPIGGFTVEVSGGSPPFSYQLAGMPPMSSPTFTGLSQGSYTLVVRDAEGCELTQTVTVPGSSRPSAQVVDWEDAWCGEDNGLILISGNGGSPPYRFALAGGAFQDLGLFEDLAGGQYLLVLEDAQECTDTLSVTLLQTGAPEVEDLLIGPTNCGETNGTLEILVSGGMGTLRYRLNAGAFQTQRQFTGLAPGSYTVYIRDEPGCQIEALVDIPGSGALELEGLFVQSPTCGVSNGRIEVYGQGMQFAIRGGTPQESGIFEGLAAGNYPLRIISDDCMLDTFFRLEQGPCPYFIPNSFSPNGDGINDLLQVYGPAGQRVMVLRMTLFDRWGELLWEQGGFYLDDPDAPWWDGRFRGKPLDADVFVYTLEVLPEGSVPIRFKGDVQLIR